MARRLTHKDRVLQYIKDNGSITSYEAFRELGVTRLSAVIFDLKKLGYKFTVTDEASKNRYGDTVHFAKYRLLVPMPGTESEDWGKKQWQ